MKQLIAKFIADEQGQDIIEYALIGSFVSFGAYSGAQRARHGLQHLVRRTSADAVGVGSAKAVTAVTP